MEWQVALGGTTTVNIENFGAVKCRHFTIVRFDTDLFLVRARGRLEPVPNIAKTIYIYSMPLFPI